MENLNYLDAVLGGIVILSALIGLARGFVKEVLSLFAWIAAIYVAWLFAERVANDYIRQFIDDELVSYLAAFGLLFLAVLFIIGLFNLVITQLFNAAGMGGLNRLLGMLFGFARGFVIGALVVFVLNLTPLTRDGWWQQSQLRPYFADVGEWGWSKLPDKIRSLLRQGGDHLAEVGARLQETPSGQRQKATDPSHMAARPDVHVPDEQRNAFSKMGNGDLHLESMPDDQEQTQPPVLQLESVQ